MKSPFPGMDPYLESHWGDIHHSLVTYARDHIQPCLPSDLRSRVGEIVFTETFNEIGRASVPDVRVVERPWSAASSAPPAGGQLAVAEPLVLRFPSEEITEGYVEIKEAGSGDRVITVIEILSRSNKRPGQGRRKYMEKQDECHEGDVNLVEIDLLRRGDRVFRFPQEALSADRRAPYQISVWRSCHPDQYEFYAISLHDRLPTIAIPLRESDHDVPLDLQALLSEAFQKGGYNDLDYTRDPDPPLEGDDAAWADALLREQGLRK